MGNISDRFELAALVSYTALPTEFDKDLARRRCEGNKYGQITPSQYEQGAWKQGGC